MYLEEDDNFRKNQEDKSVASGVIAVGLVLLFVVAMIAAVFNIEPSRTALIIFAFIGTVLFLWLGVLLILNRTEPEWSAKKKDIIGFIIAFILSLGWVFFR